MSESRSVFRVVKFNPFDPHAILAQPHVSPNVTIPHLFDLGSQMRHFSWFFILFPMLIGNAWSQSQSLAQAQYLAFLHGELNIRADGRVESVTLKEDLGERANESIRQVIMAWQFEPIKMDRDATSLNVQFSTQVLMQRDAESGKPRINLMETTFSEINPSSLTDNSFKSTSAIKPPKYPTPMIRANVGAYVLMMLETDADHTIVRAAPVQVDLLVGSGVQQLSNPLEFADLFDQEIQRATLRKQVKLLGANHRFFVPFTFTLADPDSLVPNHWFKRLPVQIVAPPWTKDLSKPVLKQELNGRIPSQRIRLKNG